MLGPFRRDRTAWRWSGTARRSGRGSAARRPAAGGDDDAARGEPPAVDHQRVGRHEARLAAQHRGAERAEAGLGIGRVRSRRSRRGRARAPHPSRSRARAGGCRTAPAPRAAWAACAAASSALLGTQPKFRQSPPIRSRSISATRRPSCAATAVTDRPAAPAPITARSKSGIAIASTGATATGSSDSTARPISGPRMAGARRSPRGPARPPIASTSPQPGADRGEDKVWPG